MSKHTRFRWLLVLLVVTAVSGAFWAVRVAVIRHEERPVRGALTFARALDSEQVFTLGDFTVSWNPSQGGSLSVVQAGQPDKVMWSTLPGAAFAGAARGKERVRERRGMFTIRDRRLSTYSQQHLASIDLTDGAVVVSGSLRTPAADDEVEFEFTLAAHGPDRLRFALETDAVTVNRTFLTYASEKDEAFFGFGAQFTYMNLKGRRVPVFVSEQGIGRGRQPLTFIMDLLAGAGGAWHTSYAPVPHYLTSAMRSVFLETHAYSVFDLREENSVQVSLFDGTMQGGILAGDTPVELIAAYTETAGRMRPLPDWILEGAVVGIQGGTRKVRRVWQLLQEHDTPVAAFWLQDWVGQRKTIVGKQLWWNWELDRNHYPEWETLLDRFEEKGIRVMTYVNPFLIDPAAKDHYERNLFQEALDAGYLLRHQDDSPYLVKNTDFSAAMVDLSNPAAYGWMRSVLREQVIAAGASGWMADFGEALPYDAKLHSGESAAGYHNRYPEVWARLNREVIEETGSGDDFVFFMRSGYRKSPRYSTLFWLGDQMTTWDEYDGIKSAVTGLLSSGLSGYAFNHSDIGGYTAVATPLFSIARTPELLMRWMELNAFSVVFRTHEGVAPDVNHQIYSDETTMNHFSLCAKIYTAWGDYRKHLVQQASETGLPVVRHPFIHYPRDKRVWGIRYEQFMVGDVFMIAPVLDPGVDKATCYLPEGNWTHLWTREHHAAPESGMIVTVDAPLGRPAVFYRKDAPEAQEFANNLSRLNILPEPEKKRFPFPLM